MLNIIQVGTMVLGILSLWVLGYQDLRYRRVDHEWLYLIILGCGIFSGGNWIEKIFCLIVVPAVLLGVAYLREKKKLKKKGETPTFALAISQIGGADLKTISVVGFMSGSFMLALSIILSLLLGIPFFLRETLGMKSGKNEEVKTDISGKLPLVFLLAVSLTIVYAALWIIAALKR